MGTRVPSTRTIARSFAPAPLRDRLWSLRLDSGGAANRYMLRYAGEWAVDTAASAVERALGSATQRQDGTNRYNSVLVSWTSAPKSNFVNSLSGSVSTFLNETLPVTTAPQLTFPSLQDGASFRMPQETRQTRVQISDTATLVRGAHTLRFGGEVQRVDAEFRLGVFQQGRIEYIQDFPTFDHTGDGVVDDDDLLFAVTLRSGKPDQQLLQPDADNTHVAGFIQDDFAVSDHLQLNVGLRYEVDSEVNNQSRVDELNPIILGFVTSERQRDLNNFGPRIGFAWNPTDRGLIVRGGYGLYYDRIVLQIQSLERGLDGRALPIEVRAGNTFFLDPMSGRMAPIAPRTSNPFSGFVLPGAGASGINIIDPHLQNPSVHEFHLGVEQQIGPMRGRVDVMHNQGIHFLIGREVGEVYNPVVGGPDRVVNIESSARTQYDGLLVLARSSLQRELRIPRRLHAREGVQLRQRRSDPVPERARGSQRPRKRVGPNAQRPAASAGAVRTGAGVWWGQCLGTVDDLVGRPDGHHDARRPIANPRDRSQRRRAAVQDRVGAEYLHHGPQRQRRHRRSAASTRLRERSLQRLVQLG